ncbi:MFS transporter [Streptococcus hyovaginalis]|uniref:MFS transporter n=1 Tax=Streptococcus hyovaginalis TaxID=149015 RepID=UPI0003F4BFF0|nr:MFS transporter [Streptococcus hyovaginalis]
MFTLSYRRNIALLGATEFFAFFGITTFWLLFLSQHGMALWQIGILESIFHFTSLISEVPSGMLADRFSYKTNLYLSRLASIFSSVLMLVGHGNFWLYALGMIINAWAYNFDSGTSSAMLFESVKEAGMESKFLKISSFFAGVAEVTRTLGILVAGFFVHGLLDVTYMIHIVLSLFVLFFIFLMKEPSVKLEREKSPTLKMIMETVFLTFKREPQLFIWMIKVQFLSVVMTMFYFYYQNEITVLTSWQISVMMLVSSVINIACIWLASRLGQVVKATALFPIIVGLTGIFYLLSWFRWPVFYILIYLVTEGLFALFEPIFGNDLQRMIPSDVRATMLSVVSMLFSLAMILIFPVTGWMIDRFGFANSFVYLGSLLLLATVFLRLQSKSKV